MKIIHLRTDRSFARHFRRGRHWTLLILTLSGVIYAAGCHSGSSPMPTSNTAPAPDAVQSVPTGVNPDIKAKVDSAKQAGDVMGRAEADYHRAHPLTAGAPK